MFDLEALSRQSISPCSKAGLREAILAFGLKRVVYFQFGENHSFL